MKNAENIFYSCIFIMVVWIVGLSTFSAGSTFATFIFNKLYIDQAYYYLFEVLLNGDSNKYAANYGILLIICMFATSIIIYLVLKFLLFKIPKLNRFENYFYSNLKLLNKCMTLGVVFFGFFPLYLSLVKVDGDLTKEINVLVLLFSAGFFVPYVSLLLESIYRILVKENEEMDREGSAKKRNDIPSLGNAEGKRGRVLSESIREKNYKVVTNSIKIMKELNEKKIFKELLNDDLTKLYLNHLENNYTFGEIKLMKQTLENEISTKSSLESKFIAALGVVMVLIVAIITFSNDLVTDLANIGSWLMAMMIGYIALIFIDFFGNQSRQIKKVKLLNHLNLVLALKKSYGDDK